MNAIILGSFSTNPRERVVARITQHGTRRVIDLRVFNHTAAIEFPSKIGLSLHLQHLRALHNLIRAAIGESIERGLLDEEPGDPGSGTEGDAA